MFTKLKILGVTILMSVIVAFIIGLVYIAIPIVVCLGIITLIYFAVKANYGK